MEVPYHIRQYFGVYHIPLHRPYIGLIYGRYLQFGFLEWPLTQQVWECHGKVRRWTGPQGMAQWFDGTKSSADLLMSAMSASKWRCEFFKDSRHGNIRGKNAGIFGDVQYLRDNSQMSMVMVWDSDSVFEKCLWWWLLVVLSCFQIGTKHDATN